MNIKQVFIVSAFLFPATANAVTLVTTSDPGFDNDSIGTVLNLTNGGETGPCPVSNDSTLNFPTAPILTAAAPALGNWLTNPGSLNGNWTAEASIPNTWTPGDEVATIYRFDTLGATNVQASFGVDNGMFAWLDGEYLFGARAGGGASAGEYLLNLGDLDASTHYLQLLLEDHGGSNAYNMNITADTFLPGPPSATTPSQPRSLYISQAASMPPMVGLGGMQSKTMTSSADGKAETSFAAIPCATSPVSVMTSGRFTPRPDRIPGNSAMAPKSKWTGGKFGRIVMAGTLSLRDRENPRQP